MYMCRPSPRLSDRKGGGGRKSNVPCCIKVAIRDLVVFGLGLWIIFTEAAPGSDAFVVRVVQAVDWNPITDVALTVLGRLEVSPGTRAAVTIPSYLRHTVPWIL